MNQGMGRVATGASSRSSRLFWSVALCAVLRIGTGWSQEADPTGPFKIDDNGTVHLPAMAVPVSPLLSHEGQAYVTEHLHNMQKPELLVQHDGVPGFMEGYLARQRELFAVDRQDTTVGGVHAQIYVPAAGIPARNRHRVLIELHGGGFHECWPGCAELESRPLAALGRIKVVSLDFREAPKYRFPAASEDVAAAYRELLKTYRPQDIGIYGCSAGGMLTAMSVAWFQKHSLPRPGAVGIFCAGATLSPAGFGGDANYTSMGLGEGRLFPRPPDGARKQSAIEYLADADPQDPLVAPASSPEVLAKFPPTLIITGTRGFEMSSAVYTHSRLVKAGVQAELHVWEGLFHGFFYNPDVPESRDCYDVMVRFFNRYLGHSG